MYYISNRFANIKLSPIRTGVKFQNRINLSGLSISEAVQVNFAQTLLSIWICNVITSQIELNYIKQGGFSIFDRWLIIPPSRLHYGI